MTFYLINHFTWRSGYLTVAVVQIALAFLFLFTNRLWKSQNKKDQVHIVQAKSKETLRLKSTWLGIAIFLVYTGIEASVGLWIFTILTTLRMLPEGAAGFWTSAYWGSLTAGRILSGFVMSRFPVQKVMTVCIVGILAGTSLIAVNLSNLVTLAGIIVTGFSVAPVFPTLISMTPDRIGEQHAANAVGFQISAAMIGSALLPGFAGVSPHLKMLKEVAK